MLRRRQRSRTVREGSLAIAAIAAGALMLCTPAQAEPAKAGRFWQEGMMAMWDIGMLLPDANNRIHTSACRVSPQRAICRYVVAVDGKRPCEATGVLTRSYYRFPARTWGCPQAWRPVLAEIPQLHDPASKAIYLGR